MRPEEMNEDCVFCKIISKKKPARIIYLDDDTIAFFPREMNVKGHLIVAPIQHCTNLFDIRTDTLSSLMKTVSFLAGHFKRQLSADGINLLHASGEAAQQSIFHFHIHLLPRFKNDHLDAWPELPVWNGALNELLMKLKVHETSRKP